MAATCATALLGPQEVDEALEVGTRWLVLAREGGPVRAQELLAVETTDPRRVLPTGLGVRDGRTT